MESKIENEIQFVKSVDLGNSWSWMDKQKCIFSDPAHICQTIQLLS